MPACMKAARIYNYSHNYICIFSNIFREFSEVEMYCLLVFDIYYDGFVDMLVSLFMSVMPYFLKL